MRILFINPNTSASFTKRILDISGQYASPMTDVVAMNPDTGPRSIESVYDELLSSMGTLEMAIREMDAFDAIAIACFSDHPTIYALRELWDKPVVGIAEASMYMACMLGYKFSIVTTNDAWEPLLWEAVHRYGLNSRCASVRTTGMPVLALDDHFDASFEQIQAVAQAAVELDHAEVICLGCAGMAGLDKRLESRLGIPVVDGVVAALKILEGLVGYGISTSKQRAFTQPGYKLLDNLPDIYSKHYLNES